MAARTLPHVPATLARNARERFQRRYAEPLSDEDGREIATNLLGLFGLLREWRAAETASASASASARTKAPSSRRRRSTPSAE